MLDKAKVYYLCGPMTGFKNRNYPVFNAEAKRLRELGFTIINPADLHPLSNSSTYEDEDYKALRKDLSIILSSVDGILVMPGWEFSYGCNAEVSVAKAVKIPIYNIELTVGDSK